MSRTKRANLYMGRKYTKFMRTPKTQNSRVQELRAISELSENCGRVSNRLKKRANPTSKVIPTAYDDMIIASYFETDYNKRR